MVPRRRARAARLPRAPPARALRRARRRGVAVSAARARDHRAGAYWQLRERDASIGTAARLRTDIVDAFRRNCSLLLTGPYNSFSYT